MALGDSTSDVDEPIGSLNICNYLKGILEQRRLDKVFEHIQLIYTPRN